MIRKAHVCLAALTIAIPASVSVAIANEAPAKAKLEFRIAKSEKTDGYEEAKVGDQTIWLARRAAITDADVESAKVVPIEKDGVTRHQIEVALTVAGGEKMKQITGNNEGSMLAIVVDGKVLSAPIIKARIGDRAVITANFTKAEAENLAKRINGK